MSVLVIAEHDNNSLSTNTLNVLSAAKALSSEVFTLVAGHQCEAVANALKVMGAGSEILLADNIAYEHFLAESFAALIVDIAGPYDYVIAPASTFGKNILPRAAAMLDCPQISDVIKVIDDSTFAAPIYAGNAIATFKLSAKKKFLTIRPTAFSELEKSENQPEIKNITFEIKNEKSKFIKAQLQAKDKPKLSDAAIVISGGRGLGDKETFARLEKIAERLGAAMGASRAAVDAGLAPNDFQVGQTGQIVAPKLYIAVGISGAIQHLAGMKDSQIIVAINKDPDAPIFEIADYGIVGDLKDILPQWEEMLEKLGY